MKKNILKIYLLTIAVSLFLTPLLMAAQPDGEGQQIVAEEILDWDGTHFDEKADAYLHFLGKENPKKAEKLKELRASDPKKFRDEIMRDFKKHWEQMSKRKDGKHPETVERMLRAREKDFMDWLIQNYPERMSAIEKMDPAKQGKDNRFDRIKHELFPIYSAERRGHTQLAEILRKDLALKSARDIILQKLAESDTKENDELIQELRVVVSERFDILIQKKQFRLEMLLARLKELQSEVKRQEESLEKLDTEKSKHVEQRLLELTTPEEKVNWD